MKELYATTRDLEPGEVVILNYSRPWLYEDRIGTVERKTSHQVIVAGRRFHAANGCEVGMGAKHDTGYWRLEPATPERLAEVQRQHINRRAHEKAYYLTREIADLVPTSVKAPECISHLKAALNVLKGHD